MDPVTVTTLALAGINTVRKIMDAIESLHENRSTPEQVALLESLRAENQAKSDALEEKLDAVDRS